MTRALRALHIANGLEPELGGPTTAIINYVACTDDRSVQSHVVSPIDDTESRLAHSLREKLSENRVSLVPRTGRFKGRVSRWGISLPLARWVSTHASEFDVLILHGAWSFSSVAGLNAGRKARKPCVIVPHESLTGYDVNRKGSLARIIAKRSLKRLYGQSCRLIIFASKFEASQSFPTGSRAKQAILPFPLFDDRVTPAPAPRDFHQSEFRIGFLGRLHPKKNVDVLLKALALLPDRFTLSIGGDGPAGLRSTLESLAEALGIASRVSWRGFVGVGEKDDFFHSIDVLVMPSVFESFGIVAAEAMMRGVPAVVSPTTGVSEMIRTSGGGVVAEATESRLAETLASLDADRDRMAVLSKEAIGVATRELSFSHAGNRLRDQFMELASEARR